MVPRRGIMDGIEIVRQNWHRLIFDSKDKMHELIKSYVMDEKTQQPKHDSSSHPADALKYMILGYVLYANSTSDYSKQITRYGVAC